MHLNLHWPYETPSAKAQLQRDAELQRAELLNLLKQMEQQQQESLAARAAQKNNNSTVPVCSQVSNHELQRGYVSVLATKNYWIMDHDGP